MDGQGNTITPSLTRASRWLGYAGLLPQIICVAIAASGHDYAYTALAGGYAYAAAIFSFLGGVWWGQGIASGKSARAVTYMIAVLPSLIAVALFLPWTLGWEWPAPALMYLGALIAASPLVDKWLGFAQRDFLILRWQLSLGLGALTFILGLQADALMGSLTPQP